jgi:hypothetical protein
VTHKIDDGSRLVNIRFGPRQRTSAGPFGMSAKGPKTDSCTATKASIKITALDVIFVSPEPYLKLPFLNWMRAYFATEAD